MRRLTAPLADAVNEDPALSGGKGANLCALMGAGLPVPAGFVLVTAAYEQFLQENGLHEHILELAGTVAPAQPASVADAAQRIQGLIAEATVPKDVVRQLLAATADLGEMPLAVRSSATAEDLPGASFAGQQTTLLNVQREEELLEAVKACWASLWSARALAYRVQKGFDHAQVSMAVVVQALVPADVSGILFTANPTSGARDEFVINAAFGLGEAIVSGQVAPDTYLVSRLSKTVREARVGEKRLQVVTAPEGGTRLQEVERKRREGGSLDPTQLRELAALGERVEGLFDGTPQDIEWAIAGGRIWLLQSRPITQLPPPPLRDVHWNPPRPGSVWMRRQIVEHMPEPLSPLFAELYVEEGLDSSMESMAEFISDLSGIQINLWEIVEPPFATTINGYAYSTASFEVSAKTLPYLLRIYFKALPKMLRHLYPRWRVESLPAYLATIEHWKNIDLVEAGDEELLQGIRALAYEDAVYWFAAAVPLGMARTSDSALNAFLKVALGGRKGNERSPVTSAAFLRGFPSQAVEAEVELQAIGSKISLDDKLRRRVLQTPAADVMAALEKDDQGQPVLEEVQGYLERYGHQVYNLDFAAPTLADDPLPVLLSLQEAVKHPERDARARQRALSQERETLVTRTLHSLNPISRPVFRRLLTWAQRYAPIREEALFYVGAAWPTARRLALELGKRLAEAGSLAEAGDVFYLRSVELMAASGARLAGAGRPELAQLARERRLLREARKRLDPPPIIPPDGRMKFGPISMAMFEPKPRKETEGAILHGFAVSPGKVRAPASVVRSPEDFDQMAPDSILVCTSTTPAWTPLFSQARGLVTDIGGALAHGSIVAREYGIPAVMGTGVATQRISHGQMIEVDGERGQVTLVDGLTRGEKVSLEHDQGQTKAQRNRGLIIAIVATVIALVTWWRKRR